MKRICYVFLAGFMGLSSLQAQDSMKKPEVAEIYKMFAKTMVRRMDLEEKQNRPFFSRNGELPKILIDAANNGDLKVYRSDSCLNVMADSTMQNMMAYTVTQQVPQDSNDPFSPLVDTDVTTDIPSNLFTVAYIKEDVIFDRNRSRMYWYINTLTITVPGKPEYVTQYGITGEMSNYMHFKYEEVVDVMRSDKYKDEAIWYNGQNVAAHRNMSDAFELRIFSAPIIKVSNNQDLDIRQQYGNEIAADPMKAMIIQQKLEYDLSDYEAELWSY
ncbi:MAG: gliding motility protein GldN [Cytophagales bacterium]|nr:gliding motility protein GldN [Cytophagales bacterium]